MSKPRSPLDLARRWTAGALLAATLGAGAVGVHLATDQGTATAGSAATSATSDTSSSGSTTSSNSSGFGAVSEVTPGTSSAQSSTGGS